MKIPSVALFNRSENGHNTKEDHMKKLLIAGAITMALTGTVYANDCPNLIKQDEDMAKMMPGDAATMVKVEEQIALAKKEHEAGNHDASIIAAKEAWKLLGM